MTSDVSIGVVGLGYSAPNPARSFAALPGSGYITRSGDIWSPQIPASEPLRLEYRHFLEAVIEGREPLSGGESGLRVVRVLERLQQELDASRHPGGARAH